MTDLLEYCTAKECDPWRSARVKRAGAWNSKKWDETEKFIDLNQVYHNSTIFSILRSRVARLGSVGLTDYQPYTPTFFKLRLVSN